MVSFLAYGILAYVAGNALMSKYLTVQFVPGSGELAVLCGAVVGACTAFLWACSLAVSGQTNIAAIAVASADTFLVGHIPSAAIDGDTTDGNGWIAAALDTSHVDETNIALSATAIASAYNTGNGGRPPEDAIDGITGEWTGWEATATLAEIPQWLELTWPSAQIVNLVPRLCPGPELHRVFRTERMTKFEVPWPRYDIPQLVRWSGDHTFNSNWPFES